MKLLSNPLLLSVLASSFLSLFAQADCSCGDVCSYYNNPAHQGFCWQISHVCSNTPPMFCPHVGYDKYGNAFCYDPLETCAGWCSCNLFGCNCGACGDCDNARNRLRGRSLPEAQPNQQQEASSSSSSLCTDYHYYMNLTLADKFDHLESRICQNSRNGNRAKHDIVNQVESAADADRDGILSCEEFNDSHANLLEASNLCEERAL